MLLLLTVTKVVTIVILKSRQLITVLLLQLVTAIIHMLKVVP